MSAAPLARRAAPAAAPPRQAASVRRPEPQALSLALDHNPAAPPLYRQIQDGVRTAVRSGVLAEGARLPPERELAAILGVNRATVTRAYGELLADGVVEARPGRGTTVRAPRPEEGTAQFGGDVEAAWLAGLAPFGHGQLGPDPNLLRDMAALGARSDLISLAVGAPSADLIPLPALQEALAVALAHTGAAGLGYGSVEGLEALRAAIAARLAGRGVRVAPDELLITSGATQAVALVASALLEPGDEVAVEAPTYVGALQTLASAGVRLVGVPLDADGLRMDLLESVLARRRIRLILVQPNQQNPTSTTLSAARRERLLWLGRRYGVPIVEDEVYGELWHAPPDPRPLKALDRAGQVLHLGSFSKTVAPGLRVGWLVASPAVVRRLTLAKQFADLNTNTLAQLALAQFLTSGAYERHLASVRHAYAERRAAMLAALQSVPHLAPTPGAGGGFYCWCRLPRAGSARRVVGAASRAGVAVLAGDAFYPPDAPGGDGRDHLRLSFAGAPPEAIAAGVARLARVLEQPSDVAPGPAAGVQPLV